MRVKNFTLLLAILALAQACVKGPPTKNPSKKTAKTTDATITEKVETIVVDKSLKLSAPAFKEVLAKPVNDQIKTMSLKQIFARPNSSKDVDLWFSYNDFKFPTCHPNNCSAKIPSDYQGLVLTSAIPTSEGYFLIYGPHPEQGHLVLMADQEAKKAEYAIDFSNYASIGKENTPPLSINYIKREGDILYVSYGHKKLAKDSGGINSFLTAFKLPEGKVLWHSNALIANSFNFAIMGDYLVTGYGNTGEPDFLYLLNKQTGAVTQTVSLVTGPEYIMHRGNQVYVRSYNTNYIFEIERP